MGVYIAAMENPKTCGECIARHLAKCGVTIQWILGPEEHYKTKKEDCPLVELPTAHGRLIDANKLTDDIATLLERNNKLIDSWLANLIQDEIDDAPTILEEER